jgi:branched-chain amino acid aminotransferase
MNGQITPWSDSLLHVNTDCVLRGANVFEGIRGYVSPSEREVLIFRLDDHIDRLFHISMRVLRLSLAYTEDDIKEAVLALVRANRYREDVHIRVVAYFGEGPEGSFDPKVMPTGSFILAIPRPHPETIQTGVRCIVSPWRRISDNAMPPRVKAGANYLNSRYALADARAKGYDLPVLLNERGKVSEGAAQCLFAVRGGRLLTPRLTDGILESITRDTVLKLAARLDIAADEREIDVTEIYVSDELFFAGTMAGITPIVEIDNYRVGNGVIGGITGRIQSLYFDVVRGATPGYAEWLTPVYGADAVIGEQGAR